MDSARGAAAAYNMQAHRNGWNSLCDATLAFLQNDLIELLKIWRAAAKQGIPSRSALSPRVLKSFLRDVALYERVEVPDAGRRYRVRLMGTSFAQILGDYTGKFVDEVVPAEFVALWHTSLDTTLAAGAPLRFLGREDTNQMTFLTGEFFSAPLLADDGTMTMVLGAARYSGKRPWEEVEAEAKRQLGFGGS